MVEYPSNKKNNAKWRQESESGPGQRQATALGNAKGEEDESQTKGEKRRGRENNEDNTVEEKEEDEEEESM